MCSKPLHNGDYKENDSSLANGPLYARFETKLDQAISRYEAGLDQMRADNVSLHAKLDLLLSLVGPKISDENQVENKANDELEANPVPKAQDSIKSSEPVEQPKPAENAIDANQAKITNSEEMANNTIPVEDDYEEVEISPEPEEVKETENIPEPEEIDVLADLVAEVEADKKQVSEEPKPVVELTDRVVEVAEEIK